MVSANAVFQAVPVTDLMSSFSVPLATLVPGASPQLYVPVYHVRECPTSSSVPLSDYVAGASPLLVIPVYSPSSSPSGFAKPVASLVGGSIVLPTLGPTTASFTVGATSGSLITTLSGLASGETIASVSPNDGRIAISSGSAIVVGLTASSAGTINYTLTTSLGRTLTVAVTANAVAYTATALGVYAPNDTGSVQAFYDWLGTTPAGSFGDAHSGRANQSDWVGSVGYVLDASASFGTGKTMSIAIPLFFQGGSFDALIAGSYDANITQMANDVLSRLGPYQSEIRIRTGWEMNGSFQPWGIVPQGGSAVDATLAAKFVSAWKRFRGLFMAVSSKFKFIFCVNNGSYDYRAAYPGDDQVDYIGVDFYEGLDGYVASSATDAWNHVRTVPFGLDDVASFNTARGKILCVNEFGVSKDNYGAYYEAFFAWCTANKVAFAGYWNTNGGYPSLITDGSLRQTAGTLRSLWNPTGYPNKPAIITPTQNVRLAITGAVVDSAGDATTQTAVQNSSANKKHARVALATSQTRSVTIPVAAVASPGGIVYLTVDRQDLAVYQTSTGLGATATVERSFDNGSTWSTMTLAQGGNLDQGRTFSLPTGAASLVRITGVNSTVAAANLAIALYQRPASGKMDGWLIHGASFEDFGHNPLRFTDALQAAFPAADPFVHTQGLSGQTTAQISSRAVADYPNFPLCKIAYFNQGGNSLNPRPAVISNADFNNMKADITAAINAAKNAGMFPLITNISYRDLPDPYVADNTQPQNGSDPVNKGVLYPLFKSLAPDQINPELGVTWPDQYGFFLPKRKDSQYLTQGDQHPRDGYVSLRTLEAASMTAIVYGQPFPASSNAYESAVAAFESAKTIATKNPAYDLVTSLPASRVKTLLSNRLQAFTVAQPANTAVPTITGTAAVGEVLTLSPGTWSNTPLYYQYTLTRSDGTTAASGTMAVVLQTSTIAYTGQGADQGKTLTLNVQAINGNGVWTAFTSSAATGTVAAPVGQSNGGSSAANTFPFTGSADAVTGPNLYTDTPEASTWTRANLATPVTGQADCRNGFTAIKLSPANDGGNNLRRFSKSVSGLTANDTQQISIEARGTGDATKGGRYLFINSGATNGQVVFDLINGTFSTPQSGVTAYMTDLGNGWWRLSLRAAINATSKLAYFQIQGGSTPNTAADTTYPGDGTSGVVVTKVYFAKV